MVLYHHFAFLSAPSVMGLFYFNIWMKTYINQPSCKVDPVCAWPTIIGKIPEMNSEDLSFRLNIVYICIKKAKLQRWSRCQVLSLWNLYLVFHKHCLLTVFPCIFLFLAAVLFGFVCFCYCFSFSCCITPCWLMCTGYLPDTACAWLHVLYVADVF